MGDVVTTRPASERHASADSISPGQAKTFLLEQAIGSYREGYKELSDTWRNLESKAQGNIAVSGIFVGGVFAYVQKLDPYIRFNNRVLLAITTCLLMASVISSLLALRIRPVPTPLGGFIDTMVIDLLQYAKSEPELGTRLSAFYYDQLNEWRRVENEVTKSINLKGRRLKAAQGLLTVAILTIGLLTVLKIFY